MANGNNELLGNLGASGDTTLSPAAASASASASAFIPRYQEQAIPFIDAMKPDERATFANSLGAINAKKAELRQIAQDLADRESGLATATEAKKSLGALPTGNASFRGRNGPAVYVAQNPGTGELEVRGNFMESGYPFRVSNPNSFNAVLRNMKTKRRNVSGKVSSHKSITNAFTMMEKQYTMKQQELQKLISKLQKDLGEYKARELKAYKSGMKPFVVASSVPTRPLSNSARQALGGPSNVASAPKATRRWWPFGKSGGATKKRRGSRKTRKGRKANRR